MLLPFENGNGDAKGQGMVSLTKADAAILIAGVRTNQT